MKNITSGSAADVLLKRLKDIYIGLPKKSRKKGFCLLLSFHSILSRRRLEFVFFLS